MKILNIELNNLNSLRGIWKINLSDKIYEANGIFAVTGPTGAGKTTIFDAVTLALYGCTPRLGKITKASNEIMSRHTNECYAKVIFEVGGKKYLSCWEQHRGGKNKALQEAKHYISNAETGEIFSDKISDTADKVCEITGLDFKRFRQAVMLEQGGFDAFLKAGKNDRAQILELLTGTEIYGKISKLVFERCKDEGQKLSDIKFKRDNIKHDDDEFQNDEEITEALKNFNEKLEATHKNLNDTRKNLEWRKGIQKLENELKEIFYEIQQLAKRSEILEPDLRRLETALKASELAVDFSTLKTRRENCRKIHGRVESLRESIVNCEKKIFDIETLEIPDIKNKIQYTKKNLSPDESPEIFCSMLKERMNAYTKIAKKKNEIEKAKKQTMEIFRQASENLKISEEKQKSAYYNYEAARKKADEFSNMRIEAILEIERNNLKPGMPCPVCGSTEHPKIIHFGEKISGDVMRFDAPLKKAQTEANAASKALEEANRDLQNLKSIESETRAKQENYIREFNDLSGEWSASRAEIENLLRKIGIMTDSSTKLGQIKSAVDSWLLNFQNLEKNLEEKNKKLENFKITLAANKENFSKENSEYEISKSELQELEKNFAEKLREKNFENEKIFSDSILDEKEIKKINLRKQELENYKNKLQALKDDREKKLAQANLNFLTPKTGDELEAELKELEKSVSEFNRKIFELDSKREKLKKIQREVAKLDKEYKEQEKIFSDWSALSQIIGQASGDKFRIFAQRVTLEKMIELANVQLEKMYGRYVLTARPDDSQGLELSVIDREQANEIRPTKNLSGGERFIVSLALALGLSQISANKTRIDSLFLDEGFGSLDEEALNTALEALSELHRSGRMIGIISHVQSLRERISAKIEVVPVNEGVSIMKGFGVERG